MQKFFVRFFRFLFILITVNVLAVIFKSYGNNKGFIDGYNKGHQIGSLEATDEMAVSMKAKISSLRGLHPVPIGLGTDKENLMFDAHHHVLDKIAEYVNTKRGEEMDKILNDINKIKNKEDAV